MKLYLAPLAAWERKIDNMRDPSRLQLSDEAASDAIRSVRLSVYVESRRQGKDHPTAVKAQNSAAAKVRKVLGFAYRDDITF